MIGPVKTKSNARVSPRGRSSRHRGEIISEFIAVVMTLSLFFFLIFTLYSLIRRDQMTVRGENSLFNRDAKDVVFQTPESKRLIVDVLEDRHLSHEIGQRLGIPGEFFESSPRFKDADGEVEKFEKILNDPVR